MTLTHAIVRPPATTFALGLTTAALGPPDHPRAQVQHQAYCRALEQCGLTVSALQPERAFPDSTFVEDDAVILRRSAVITRPGALSRRGEVTSVRDALSGFFPMLTEILPPGTLDGGDVCDGGETLFIGISDRTNDEGASQLAGLCEQEGVRAMIVDIRTIPGLLHLKSGLAYLGGKRLLAAGVLAHMSCFEGYDVLEVPAAELYAANCVRVNQHILIPAGFPKTERLLMKEGYNPITLEMSEFRKMDGGLSCLSLRF